MSGQPKTFKRYGIDWSRIHPIMGSHMNRIGFWRVLIGGGSMYFSIPMFLALHFLGLEALVRRTIGPLLRIPDLPLRNYIVLDRHKIDGLSRFDKFNCLFCGYANGLSMLLHARLEQLGAFNQPVPLWKKALIAAVAAPVVPVLVVLEAMGIHLLYNTLISRPLGLRRTSLREAYQELDNLEYAEHLRNTLAGKILRHQKSFDIRLENALEQIESSWCPLKHLDQRPEVVYPPHHKKFFEPHQIEEMKQVLQTEGTVSDIKPYR